MYKDILLGFEFEIETEDIYETYYLIDELSPITEYREHRVYGYHGSSNRTIRNAWRVEEDSSILGAEFISPPMPYIKAKEMVKEFFGVIKNSNSALVTKNCGLHVNMSINGNIDALNLSTFLVSLNQSFIAALWPDRINSIYAKSIGKKFKDIACHKNINIENFAKHLFRSTHSFISLKTFNNKSYLELRTPGGVDYHFKFKELFTLIDYVANKMIANCSPKATYNNKHVKKISSYINRTSKHSDTFETKMIKLNSGEFISSEEFIDMLFSITNIIENKNTLSCLDETKDLYNIIKYCVLHKRVYGSCWDSYVSTFFNLVKNSNLLIKIPKNESTFDKIKVLKHWCCLPTQLVIDLLSSINSKHAHQYLIKHVPGGILHAVTSDSKGILKNHAITHAYKYNKAN